MNDLVTLFVWYFAFLVFGVIGLPLANKIFKDFPDKGYVFAKFIGLFLVSMTLWLLSSLKIIQFNTFSVWVFTVVALFVAVYVLFSTKSFQLNKQIILEEVAFFVVFFIWCSIRTYNSQIQGTEKFMNLAFMNSIDRSMYFPPLDQWQSGETINYYYLGHYMYVFVAKLINTTIGYAYNLALVTIIAQTFVSVISILFALFNKGSFKLKVIIATLGATWICFGGNLHYAANWLSAQIKGEQFSYFFPNPTRIIPFTINEFPSYSIVLGDLHGHYLSLPFLLLAIALVVVALKIGINTKEKLKFNLLISWPIVALYGINSWDFITVNFIFALVHIYQLFKLSKTLPSEKVKLFLKAEVALILPGIILILPYFLNFKPAVGGIGLVPFDKKSEIGPWLLMWGMFLTITVFYLGFYFRKFIQNSQQQINSFILLAVAASLVVGVEFLFLKDIFFSSNYDYFRTNTVFKFYYHAWIIWGIACSWFVYSLLTDIRRQYRKFAYGSVLVFLLLFVASFSYIFKAVYDFYPFAAAQNVALDGTVYLANTNPADYGVISWLNENVEGQPVIMEAVGEAYTYFSRISAHTGLPTIMGWPTHEWQWRNQPDVAFKRADDVHAAYQATDANILRNTVNKYNVKFIIVSEKEREKYTSLNEQLIASIYKLVFSEKGAAIYSTD